MRELVEQGMRRGDIVGKSQKLGLPLIGALVPETAKAAGDVKVSQEGRKVTALDAILTSRCGPAHLFPQPLRGLRQEDG